MHAGPKINQAGRCLPRYARISIKRHGSNQRVEVPVPLAGGGLPTLSNALPVSARNLYGPTLLPAVEKTAALPSSKFGISRPLNILVGILHHKMLLSLLFPPARLLFPLLLLFEEVLSLSLFSFVRLQDVAPTESARTMVTDLAHVVSATTEEESRILPIRPSSS